MSFRSGFDSHMTVGHGTDDGGSDVIVLSMNDGKGLSPYQHAAVTMAQRGSSSSSSTTRKKRSRSERAQANQQAAATTCRPLSALNAQNLSVLKSMGERASRLQSAALWRCITKKALYNFSQTSNAPTDATLTALFDHWTWSDIFRFYNGYRQNRCSRSAWTILPRIVGHGFHELQEIRTGIRIERVPKTRCSMFDIDEVDVMLQRALSADFTIGDMAQHMRCTTAGLTKFLKTKYAAALFFNELCLHETMARLYKLSAQKNAGISSRGSGGAPSKKNGAGPASGSGSGSGGTASHIVDI